VESSSKDEEIIGGRRNRSLEKWERKEGIKGKFLDFLS